MKRIFLIFNPAARGEKARYKRDRLYLHAAAQQNVVLAPTKTAGEATRLAAVAVREGYDLIAAAGGDGTINEVVNGIGTSGVPVAILPLGTINVFARDLGVPLKLDDAWALLNSGKPRSIDLGCTESAGVHRYFVQLAGVGLDAMGIRRTSWALKKRIGPLSYVWATLQSVRDQRTDVEVQGNGSGQNASGGLILVGNGRFYGGPFRLFPKARMDDGLLDVCVFRKGGYWNALRYAQAAMRGVHTGYRDVFYFQADHFECRAPGSVPFEVDGELAGDSPVRFSVKPGALRVLIPQTDACFLRSIPRI